MKDLYQDLLRYYRFMAGKIPNEEFFLDAVKETVSSEDLRVFFLLPFTGYILERKLLQKAKRAGLSREEFHERAERLVQQGMIMRYTKPEGRAYERGNIVYMSEQQVRMKEDTPRRRAFAEFMDAVIEGNIDSVPNRTPYYRVLPVEAALDEAAPQVEVKLDQPVSDPRRALPLDIVSEMVKAEPLVAVAECYCRRARKIVGKDCGHPLETCLAFNELAETLLEAGLARRLDHVEALQILRDCEAAGLVHFVDNAEGCIRSLCNCCSCSCVLFSVIKRGGENAGGPSRFVIRYNGEYFPELAECAQLCPTGALSCKGKLSINHQKCIGCGLCANRCRELGHAAVLRLVPRGKYPRIFKSNEALWKHIALESVAGMIANRFKKKKK
jgi:DNA-binding Lrp family transcriptional regulator